MPLEPDASAAVSSAVTREQLVQWVYETAEAQETESLEWKRGYDLAKRTGAAQTAKHLIGFANRDPAAAQRKHRGHAYLLLGVEPELAPGVKRWDSADIQRWLEPFLEPELRYDTHFVRCHEADILLFDVDAPKAGDPIFALQRPGADEGGSSLSEGAVFVRRRGMTERASANELKRLQQRLVARQETDLAFHLELTGRAPSAMRAAMFEPAHRDAQLRSLRDGLMSELPPPSNSILAALGPPLESRSPEEFTEQVNEFFHAATQQWPNFYGNFLAQEDPTWLQLNIVSDSENGFEAVAVELLLPLPRWTVHADSGAAEEYLKPPEIPFRWGQVVGNVGSLCRSPIRVEAVNDEETRVHFPRLDVRPWTAHPLEELLLILPPTLAGRQLTASWRATARGRDGDQSGDVTIPVRTREA